MTITTLQGETVIKASALTIKNDLAYYNDMPFTGGALYLDGERITERIAFENGSSVGEFNSRFIRFKSNHHLDANCLEETDSDEYFKLKGSYEFSGVFYHFVEDLCTEITALKNGFRIGDNVTFSTDGLIRNIYYYDKENMTAQILEPNENNNTISYGITLIMDTISRPRLEVTVDKLGRVQLLSLTNGILNNLDEVQHHILFPFIATKAAILSLNIAESIRFSLEDIHDEFIETFLSYNDKELSVVKKVSLASTTLSRNGLSHFTCLPNLETLESHDDKLCEDDLLWFKQQKPNCRVYYYGKELLWSE